MDIVTGNENNVEMFVNALISSAEWLHLMGKPMWKVNDLTVEKILNKYSLEEMKLCYENEKLIGVYILQWYDPLFWPELKGLKSGYLHKLSVSDEYRGKNYGNELIKSAELLCKNNSVEWLRLNCGTLRPRLRNFYEKAGFKMVDRVFIDNRDQIRYEKKLI
ncbi:GNAT family N-acetyltransferase [Cellulosilyticum sp. ST5]|uniref:GNAT family N-acetyltransferase n=1 Tax=Cellulosilyticum sp. ST5 TaxID=3055805 RepID=UPI0039778C93